MVIATVSTLITIGAGAVMTLADHDNFESIGPGLWWAVQTVTTVGYGDDVPTSFAGQLVAVLVMLFGVAFLTVVTASITSSFVERSRRDRGPSDAEAAIAEQLRQLDQRLERIEDALRRSPARVAQRPRCGGSLRIGRTVTRLGGCGCSCRRLRSGSWGRRRMCRSWDVVCGSGPTALARPWAARTVVMFADGRRHAAGRAVGEARQRIFMSGSYAARYQ